MKNRKVFYFLSDDQPSGVFLNFLSQPKLKGGTIFFVGKKAILELVDRNCIQKSTFIAKVDIRGFTILRIISGLFQSCSRVVYAVFEH